MEPTATDIQGIYLDFSVGRSWETMRICIVERTKDGTLVCHGERADGLRVVLSQINAMEVSTIMDTIERQWKIA